ncbi:PepSY-associated TM helix domain-containing protein [Paraflavisolibacter sp. H34]|uniref:PepSY-associated TM helix domain-containing protein n=1 Tax=Huijunlia imazamoxiresistens TaxID=3127457 RepID=UPI0030181554
MSTAPTVRKEKKHNRSLFYRISAWLHLWLGLVTGLIMLVVCLTGCIWVFHDEITGLLEPETRVPYQPVPVVSPAQLAQVAHSAFPGKKPNYATYQQGQAIYLALGEGRSGNTVLRIHPYSGKVLRVKEFKKGETDFFRFILNGHRFLWMTPDIGRPIVNYGTLVFVVLLFTGLVLWWPRKWTKATREQSFKVKWKATFKRVNYDLHNVFGFYALLFLLCIALTGMVYGIKWYSKGLFWMTTGQSLPEYQRPQSDSLQLGKHAAAGNLMDRCWNEVIGKHPEAEGFYYSFPDTAKPSSAISITLYPTTGKYYNNRSFAFDQHTGKAIHANALYDTPYEKASAGVKLRRMNYDIHVGSILGLPGKILAFFAALVGASLPVTGFLVWWGKRKKKPKRTPSRRVPYGSLTGAQA